MRRVVIIGGGGAGKTTLALHLGERSNLPVFHLDRLFFSTGWVAVPVEKRRSLLADILSGPGFIIDGTYPETLQAVLDQCDVIVWLDLEPGLRLGRLLSRLLKTWGKSRPDLPEGCVESDFGHMVALLRYFLFRGERLRRQIQQMVAALPADRMVVHLRTEADVQAFQDKASASMFGKATTGQ